MKIARILHESCPFPVVALERDGALYDVAELDVRFATPRALRLLGGASDFFSRVIALGGVGLDELDQRLAAGYRPTEARLAPGSFLWLPPCDPDRAMLVHVARDPAGDLTVRLGNARAILGHEAASPFPGGATQPELELGIAAILGDDLRRASVERGAASDPRRGDRQRLGGARSGGARPRPAPVPRFRDAARAGAGDEQRARGRGDAAHADPRRRRRPRERRPLEARSSSWPRPSLTRASTSSSTPATSSRSPRR